MLIDFLKGTITISGDYNVPNSRWDGRTGCYRAPAMHYRDIVDYLTTSNIPFNDKVLDLIPCPELDCDVHLRKYQKEALERWLIEKRGIVVLPTGSGKTYIAIAAIKRLNCPTFIVVPTLDLLNQWKKKLITFKIPIGEYSGEKKDLRAITVATYDSSYINAELLGNKFKFLIFDEVHHLPSEGYRHIAELFASPYRMGLTATYERDDGLHSLLPKLLGGKVYEVKAEELAGKHLSRYKLEKITVALTKKEREEYERFSKIFRDYIRKRNIKMRSPIDFQKVVMRSGSDAMAWEAIKAMNEARKIAYNSEEKMRVIEELLERHRDDKIIIFTRYNDLVYEISSHFFIPCITHETDREERIEILEKFGNGRYKAVASSQVLDEGIDVPDANIGIIVSGTGSNREFIQRLGRLLRPSKRDAILYEIVSSETREVGTSYRRKKC